MIKLETKMQKKFDKVAIPLFILFFIGFAIYLLTGYLLAPILPIIGFFIWILVYIFLLIYINLKYTKSENKIYFGTKKKFKEITSLFNNLTLIFLFLIFMGLIFGLITKMGFIFFISSLLLLVTLTIYSIIALIFYFKDRKIVKEEFKGAKFIAIAVFIILFFSIFIRDYKAWFDIRFVFIVFILVIIAIFIIYKRRKKC